MPNQTIATSDLRGPAVAAATAQLQRSARWVAWHRRLYGLPVEVPAGAGAL